MTTTFPVVQENLDEYNVFCCSCGQTFTPAIKSALWWKAKNRANKGLLDAYRCTSEECGCVQKRDRPNAPFRVFGYGTFGDKFDINCDTFVQAVIAYRRHKDDVVFIDGVSWVVERKLESL